MVEEGGVPGDREPGKQTPHLGFFSPSTWPSYRLFWPSTWYRLVEAGFAEANVCRREVEDRARRKQVISVFWTVPLNTFKQERKARESTLQSRSETVRRKTSCAAD